MTVSIRTNKRGPSLCEWYVTDDNNDVTIAESSLYHPNEAEARLAAEKIARAMLEYCERWKAHHQPSTPTKGLSGA